EIPGVCSCSKTHYDETTESEVGSYASSCLAIERVRDDGKRYCSDYCSTDNHGSLFLPRLDGPLADHGCFSYSCGADTGCRLDSGAVFCRNVVYVLYRKFFGRLDCGCVGAIVWVTPAATCWPRVWNRRHDGLG